MSDYLCVNAWIFIRKTRYVSIYLSETPVGIQLLRRGTITSGSGSLMLIYLCRYLGTYYLTIQMLIIISIIVASYLYVSTVLFVSTPKILRCQDVSKKVLGRYIHRLPEIIYVSSISIIIPASYSCIICFVGQDFKMSRCQDVSEKILGRYIRRLQDITHVSTISR